MSTNMQKGWAIHTRSEEGHGFLGKYWPWRGFPCQIHDFMNGYTVAVWETRREAREAMIKGRVKDSFPKAQVVKVLVTIKTFDEIL